MSFWQAMYATVCIITGLVVPLAVFQMVQPGRNGLDILILGSVAVGFAMGGLILADRIRSTHL